MPLYDTHVAGPELLSCKGSLFPFQLLKYQTCHRRCSNSSGSATLVAHVISRKKGKKGLVCLGCSWKPVLEQLGRQIVCSCLFMSIYLIFWVKSSTTLFLLFSSFSYWELFQLAPAFLWHTLPCVCATISLISDIKRCSRLILNIFIPILESVLFPKSCGSFSWITISETKIGTQRDHFYNIKCSKSWTQNASMFIQDF